MSRFTPAAAAAVLALTLAEPAAARRTEWAPATDLSGHADAHGDVALGLGVLTAGVGPAVGYRAAFGGRIEGAIGMAGPFSGGSLGAGYSARVSDGAFFSLEMPVMLHALALSVEPMYWDDACHHEDCDNEQTERHYGAALATGVDMLWGSARDNVGRFVLGLRVGVARYFADNVSGVAPLAQLNLGITF